MKMILLLCCTLMLCVSCASNSQEEKVSYLEGKSLTFEHDRHKFITLDIRGDYFIHHPGCECFR